MDARPDIVWVVTTQWRGQATRYAGDVNARTPFLDRLASQAINYTQAVTPHPFGPFARAALLTGATSPENGVKDYFDPLPREARTIAHELKDAGYSTAFFGKWHLSERDRGAPLVGETHARTLVPLWARGGFEFWEGFESGFLLNDPWLHGTRLETPTRFSGYQSDVVCGRAAEWLAASDFARPRFCVVSLEPPHPPYDASAGEVQRQTERQIVLRANVPTGGDVEAKARSELAGYYAHIEATDAAIGRMIEEIDADASRHGRAKPIVVFASVHGDMHGAHGLFRKGWPHEESIRVPLLVRLPQHGTMLRGAADASLVSLIDVYRWTRVWAERAVNEVRHGAGGAMVQRISMPSIVALPHQCDRRWRGVRTTEWKLVVNDDGVPWLMFDLANDSLELRNLVNESSCTREQERLCALV
jgi:arylsulfatase A-like enzyme